MIDCQMVSFNFFNHLILLICFVGFPFSVWVNSSCWGHLTTLLNFHLLQQHSTNDDHLVFRSIVYDSICCSSSCSTKQTGSDAATVYLDSEFGINFQFNGILNPDENVLVGSFATWKRNVNVTFTFTPQTTGTIEIWEYMNTDLSTCDRINYIFYDGGSKSLLYLTTSEFVTSIVARWYFVKAILGTWKVSVESIDFE